MSYHDPITITKASTSVTVSAQQATNTSHRRIYDDASYKIGNQRSAPCRWASPSGTSTQKHTMAQADGIVAPPLRSRMHFGVDLV
ncbi:MULTISPECIES: hypothetical protein [Sorangium]|uniref:hypothetical protein n=1 Tax=Sorangium TaxID=39643 RepID=UPI00101A2FC8|nr:MULTISPECIES: hypothetical protein [Sorangium]